MISCKIANFNPLNASNSSWDFASFRVVSFSIPFLANIVFPLVYSCWLLLCPHSDEFALFQDWRNQLDIVEGLPTTDARPNETCFFKLVILCTCQVSDQVVVNIPSCQAMLPQEVSPNSQAWSSIIHIILSTLSLLFLNWWVQCR